MNKRVKALWLAELRDQKLPWVQGNGRLMDGDNRACCLGVVSDIAVREGIVPPWNFSYDKWLIVTEDEGVGGVLHRDVVEWAGLEGSNQEVIYTAPDGMEITVQLSELNDGGVKHVNETEYIIPRHTFLQIADIIEAQL